MRVLDIIEGTSVDGPGLRTTIYFAGCEHKCPGCHNSQSWDMDGGTEMSVEDIAHAVENAGFSGVTFSGGDPLYQAEELTILADMLKNRGHNLWCYTGFRWEEISEKPDLRKLLETVDVLVDGPFIESQRDTALLFRGSSNQRLILSAESLGKGIKLYTPDNTPVF